MFFNKICYKYFWAPNVPEGSTFLRVNVVANILQALCYIAAIEHKCSNSVSNTKEMCCTILNSNTNNNAHCRPPQIQSSLCEVIWFSYTYISYLNQSYVKVSMYQTSSTIGSWAKNWPNWKWERKTNTL